ncbi:MAG: SBBP repeat-containing protein, partial [Deltaproteobacteria bacterium]|nr:SBBP repeat-containing protein [Deltaproteobacteria bacterium]
FGASLFALSLALSPLSAYAVPPEIEFSTFLGGTVYDSIRDMAVDTQGNIYVTGGTSSPNFPVTAGSYQTVLGQGQLPDDPSTTSPIDVFVVKFSPTGSLLWATFVGGPNNDRAYAIEVDNAGYIYLGGRAGRGFPVTAGAFLPTFQSSPNTAPYGPQDGFVAKLSPDGRQLIWSSFFGSSDELIVRDIDVDRVTGEVYLASATSGAAFPSAISSRFNNSPKGGNDAVFAKIRADGAQVLWATYVGGTGFEDHQNSIRVDSNGNLYGLTTTQSSNIATSGAFDTTYGGGGDEFVVKLSPSNGALIWGAYIGGSLNESTETHELAGTDANGNVYVTGPTRSTDFPTTTGAFQRTFGGGVNDAFVMKISSNGSTLLASTYLGGSVNDRPEGTYVAPNGMVFFSGVTGSPNFPVTPNAFRTTLGGGVDAFAAVLSADLSSVVYATYLGGTLTEGGRGAVGDGRGNFYFGGDSLSLDFPTKNAFQSVYGGGSGGDGFFARLTLTGPGTSPCDVNSDGSVNGIDIQLSVNQALLLLPCTADINNDGSCNVVDVQRVGNNILGAQCLTGP